MAVTQNCCGCHVEDDYGTSTVGGSGSADDPFFLTRVDPDFQRPLLRISRVITGQVLAANTLTVITFDTEIFSSPSTWWNPVAPTNMVVPVTGVYLIGLQGLWSGAQVGVKELVFTQTGVDIYRTEDNTSAGAGAENFVVYQIRAAAGEILQAKARSEAGGSFTAFFWACYLGKIV